MAFGGWERWLAVVLIAFITMGNYYIFDLPGTVGTGPNSIQSLFAAHHKPYTQASNGILYSVYSWPSLVVAILGGFLIDRVLGLYKGVILFTLCVLGGSIVFVLGLELTSFSWLVVSRLVFGMGGEAQIVAQYMFITRWFEDGEGISIAYGIVASLQRLGIAATFYLAPLFAATSGVKMACGVGVQMSLFSLVVLLAAVYLDRRHVAKKNLPPQTITPPPEADGLEGSERSSLTGHTVDSTMTAIKGDCSRVSLPLLLLGLYNALISSGLYGFAAIVVNYFEVKLGMTGPEAGQTVTIFYLVVIVISPILGGFIDRTGRLLYWLIGAGVLAATVNSLFTVIDMPAYLFMALLAVSQSIVLSSLYPLVPVASPSDMEALSFGLTVSMQNMGMAVATALNGWILDHFITSINGAAAAAACRVHHRANSWKHGNDTPHTRHEHQVAIRDRTHLSAHVDADSHVQLPCLAGYYTVADVLTVFYLLAALVGVGLVLLDRERYRGLMNAKPAERKELIRAANVASGFGEEGSPVLSPVNVVRYYGAVSRTLAPCEEMTPMSPI